MGNQFKKNNEHGLQQSKPVALDKQVIEILKNIGEESQSLYTLVKMEKNEVLSRVIANNLKEGSKNLYSARLLLGSTVSEEWYGIPEGLDTNMLRDVAQKHQSVDLADNIPQEDLALIKFSKSIIKKTEEVLQLSSKMSKDKLNVPKILRRLAFHLANQLEEISDNL
ncbi:MAG: hypothetical protein ACP5M9_02730 [Candidatus Micrarchaeia archaeon]